MKTYAIGTAVRLVCVDMFGLCGREPERHPQRSDEGSYTGVVVAVLEETEEPDEDESWCIYRVCSRDGRVLDLASYEVEQHRFDLDGCNVCGGDGCPECALVEIDVNPSALEVARAGYEGDERHNRAYVKPKD